MFCLWSSGCSKETEEEKVIKVINQYYEAIKAGNYSTAYNLMTDVGQKYYGTVENFKSTFEVSGIKIVVFTTMEVKIDKDKAAVKNGITYTGTGIMSKVPVEKRETKKNGLTKEKGKWKVDVKFGPYRSVLVKKTVEAHNLNVVVYAIDLYPDFVSVSLSFKNAGKEDIMILPYNAKTCLIDDSNNTFPTVELPYVLDANLYKGVTLESENTVAGFINFLGSPARDAKKLSMKIGGNLNPEQKSVFEIQVNDIKL
mgnify:CR=1 FL=1